MKFFVGLLLVTINIQAQDVYYDLALLHQSLAALEQQIPQKRQLSPSPSRADLFEPLPLNPLRTNKKPLSPQEAATMEAERFRKTMENRRTSLFKEDDEETQSIATLPTQKEDAETTRKIITDQDKAMVKALAEDILKDKRTFPNVSPELAYKVAVHLFEEQWIPTKWANRNKPAEREAERFMRTQLQPTQVEQPAETSGILGNLAGKISWLVGGKKEAETTPPAKETWET